MNPKKHLSFASLRDKLSNYFQQVEDRRQSSKSEYSLHDALMSGFACMHLQDPSLLHFQKRLEEEQGLSNLQNLFGVTQIPESTQMREIIDQVPPSSYSGMFREVCNRLQRGKHLESYRILEGRYLCSIDGTQFFSSPTIHCDQCLETHHSTGQITYSHKVLQSALMHPDHQEVIPLGSEEISNQDGKSKQDCERNAAKRLIPRLRQEHPHLKLILLGDDLFSSQPNIEATLAEKMDFIYVAKPSSHLHLNEWIETFDSKDIPSLLFIDKQGREHLYQWLHDVPLTANEKTVWLHYFSYQLTDPRKPEEKALLYRNSWVSSLKPDQGNIMLLVRAARCRWKIENECFNSLKNQGYSLEHNYGHGLENLSYNFYNLTLLAFLFHQVAQLTDPVFQQALKHFHSKAALWGRIREIVSIFIFETWETLLFFSINPLHFLKKEQITIRGQPQEQG